MSQAALPSAILDSLKTPVLVADTDHTIIYMNRAAVARYERGLALIGTSMLDCHNEQSNRVIRQTLKELEAGAEERFIYTGDLGRVYYLEGDYIHNLLYQAEQTDPVSGRNWYLEQEIPLVGGGSHPLDLLRWISGAEVVRVSAYGNHMAFPAMHCDDCQVALFQFDSGAVAKVAALYAPRSEMAPFYNLRVYGTLGTVERDQVALSESPEDVHPPFRPVEADTGSIGGHASHEFMVLAETGEDVIATCPACGYAANLEMAEVKAQYEYPEEKERPLEKVPTPGAKRVEEVASFLGVPPSKLVKTLIY